MAGGEFDPVKAEFWYRVTTGGLLVFGAALLLLGVNVNPHREPIEGFRTGLLLLGGSFCAEGAVLGALRYVLRRPRGE